MPIFVVLGLTRPGIKPRSTVSVADTLSTRPMISKQMVCSLIRQTQNAWLKRKNECPFNIF